MLPFEFLHTRVRRELHDAVECDLQLMNDDEFCRSLDPLLLAVEDALACYKHPETLHRIAALVAVRRNWLGDHRTLCATYDLAFSDVESGVRGYAWWAIAEHWRSSVKRTHAIDAASLAFTDKFHVAPEAIVSKLVPMWLDGIMNSVQHTLFKLRHPTRRSASAEAEVDEQFRRDAEVLRDEPQRSAEYLDSPSAGIRSLTIGLCMARKLWILPLERVNAIAATDPESGVRAMARQYCRAFPSTKGK